MNALAGPLVRRGMETLQKSQVGITRMKPDEEVKIEFPPWAAFAILITVVLFSFAWFSISYTYGEVVSTLASVEAPSTTAIVRTAPQEEEYSDTTKNTALLSDVDNKDTIAFDQEVLLIKQRPLTSRFCTIRRHLRAHGGRFSRYRGLHIYALYNIAISATVGLVSASVPVFRSSIPLRVTLEILLATFFTRLSLGWNHHVISKPVKKNFLLRLPSMLTVRKALFPTFVASAISHLSLVAYVYASIALGVFPENGVFQNSTATTVFPLIASILIGLFIVIAIQIPTEIAINRVRASLLSTDETPIIPFDRTFNGQVVPVEEGGRGMLTLWQAWAGSDIQTRLRVLGVYMKMFAMQISLVLIGTLVVLGEVRLALGPEYREKLSAIVVQVVARL